jgi:succinyl-CoA synthetase beta subunit
MKLHEHQSRELLAQYGIPVPEAYLAKSPGEAEEAASALGSTVVIKAQVLVGGRGKAGGVKIASSPEQAAVLTKEILSLHIKDLPVERVLVSEASTIEQEYYLGITTDRSRKKMTLMISAAGGMEIEELATVNPEAILKMDINPLTGLDGAALDSQLLQIFPSRQLREKAESIATGVYRLFREKDCSLVEINPLAAVGDESLVALDAKIVLDDNGLFKHPELEKYRNPEEYSDDEIRAREMGLAFVSMDGNIGCIVNGAGLAMATMDMIKLFGQSPANFLDVGGSSNPEKVLNALTIIKGNANVKAILINIFGGITRCDDIARGILMAQEQIDLGLPLVIRLIGTNDREGRAMLAEAGLTAYEDLTEAVRKVIFYCNEGS